MKMNTSPDRPDPPKVDPLEKPLVDMLHRGDIGRSDEFCELAAQLGLGYWKTVAARARAAGIADCDVDDAVDEALLMAYATIVRQFGDKRQALLERIPKTENGQPWRLPESRQSPYRDLIFAVLRLYVIPKIGKAARRADGRTSTIDPDELAEDQQTEAHASAVEQGEHLHAAVAKLPPDENAAATATLDGISPAAIKSQFGSLSRFYRLRDRALTELGRQLRMNVYDDVCVVTVHDAYRRAKRAATFRAEQPPRDGCREHRTARGFQGGAEFPTPAFSE